MTEERKRIEYWNYLITEKNQPRPKGITPQRLAVIKADVLNLTDLWLDVIERSGAVSKTALEFYQSGEKAAMDSRSDFWSGVRNIINQGTADREKAGHRNKASDQQTFGRTEDKAVKGQFTAKKQLPPLNRKKPNALSSNYRTNQRKGSKSDPF